MSPRKRNHFNDMDLPNEEDHPLDLISRKQMSPELNERIKSAVQTLVEALGSDITPWIDLEALLNESRQEREQILYNLGFNHGTAAGMNKASAMLEGDAGKEYRRFAEEMRKQALLSELPQMLRVAALLDVAWCLASETK